VIRVQVYSRW